MNIRKNIPLSVVISIVSISSVLPAHAADGFLWAMFLPATHGGETAPVIIPDNSDTCLIANGNATVSDNCTSLMWQQTDTGDRYDISDAVDYCEEMTLGGFSDWRLPQKRELKTIVSCSNTKAIPLHDQNTNKPVGQNEISATCCGNYPNCNDYVSPTIDNTFQISPDISNYFDPTDYTYWTIWSSPGSLNTWLVKFNSGSAYYNNGTHNYRSRCVRYQTSPEGVKIDCTGQTEGLAYLDNCSLCVGGTTGKAACTQDCNFEWGGTALLDDGECRDPEAPATPTCTSGSQVVSWNNREWQRCIESNAYGQLREARNYCETLNLGGYTDWLLPTKEDVKSLVVCSNDHPVPLADSQNCGDDGYDTEYISPTIDSTFEYVDEYDTYWAEETNQDPPYPGGWHLRISDGRMQYDENWSQVRCVRP